MTWNPIRARNKATGRTGWHCEHVSDGCSNCYAERMNRSGRGKFGTNLYYIPASRSLIDVYLDDKILTQPFHWKKSRLIFVCSMTDLFGEWVTDKWLDRMFTVMALTPQHTFQILTKHPDRMASYLFNRHGRLPLPHIWLGVSVEDQKTANERIPALLRIPAAVRFVSCEPLLRPIWLKGQSWSYFIFTHPTPELDEKTGLDWVIVGGESGTKARPMHPDWVRSIRDQCGAANVPFFFKQWGEWGPIAININMSEPVLRMFRSRTEWVNKAPSWMERGDTCVDLRGRQLQRGGDFEAAIYPVAILRRLGKRKAGRLLDGREWNEIPIFYKVKL